MAFSIQKRVAQQIVETVKDVCGWDVDFISTDGMIFASTDPSRVGTWHEIGRQVSRSGKTIEVESDSSYLGTNKGVNLPFVYHGEVAAVIGISGPPDEVRKYAYLAQKITGMILWEQDAGVQLRQEESWLNYIIRSLVSDEPASPESMLEFLGSMQLDPEARYRTVLVRMHARYGLANPSATAGEVQGAFQRTGSRLYTFSYPNEYLLILEEGQYRQSAFLLRRLAEEQRNALQVGIGGADRLSRQNLSYRSAKLAVQSLPAGQSLAVFDELDLELLLASVSRETGKRFREKTIRGLNERELAILSTYFSCGLSLKKASEKLFLHKNTLQYQLDKIARKTGYDPRAFEEAVLLYLGLKLEQAAAAEEGAAPEVMPAT